MVKTKRGIGLLKKILVATVVAITVFMLIVSPCAAWGSVTHECIAGGVIKKIDINNINAFYTGCVLPDIALANSFGNKDDRQGMFHNIDYMCNLSKYADTPELQDFVRGWIAHIISDLVEKNYSNSNKLCADWYVDRLIGSSDVTIDISDDIADIMVNAWEETYPDNDSVTASWVKNSSGIINLYLMGLYNPKSMDDAVKYFGNDYMEYVRRSVTISAMVINVLG